MSESNVTNGRLCPGCIRSARKPPNYIEITRNLCSSCNYERVKKSTTRREIRAIIETRSYELLNKRTRSLTAAYPWDLVSPFYKDIRAEAENIIQNVILMKGELDEEDVDELAEEAAKLLSTAKSLIMHKTMTPQWEKDIRLEVWARIGGRIVRGVDVSNYPDPVTSYVPNDTATSDEHVEYDPTTATLSFSEMMARSQADETDR